MSTFAPNNVIDLLSSDDEDEDRRTAPQHAARVRPVQIRNRRESVPFRAASPMVGGFPDDHAFVHGLLEPDPPNTRRLPGGEMILIDGEEVFIPDEGSTVAPDASVEGRARDQAKIHATPFAAFTFNDCLARVLEMFPDISHGYIENLYNSYDVESDYENIPGRARLDKIVEQLVSGMSYPKEEKAKLKRKREDSIDASNAIKKWEGQDRGAMPSWAKGPIAAILKADFPEIPKTYINTRFLENKHLFHTYVALAKDKDGSDDGSRTYGKGRPGKAHTADAHTIAINCGYPELVDELIAARDRVREVRKERAAADARKRAEQENLQKAIAAGEVTDCSACFDELPMNRQIHCDGSSAHFTCFGCAETYIKTQVGDSRCNVTCTTGCGAPFAKNQLDRLSDKQLVGKLAQLQQEKDIRDAGLDDLEDCPFCEYKAIMPPIEEDFEFRCANPECEKVSCRRCKAISHVPSSCEEHAKDNKINSRHKIEETMTAAMIRSCNKCKKQFIKDLGCNKVSTRYMPRR